jgi:hypothetical protein
LSKPTTYSEPSWKLYNKLLSLGVSMDETTGLMNDYAHELAERQRAEWSTIRSAITQIHPDDIAGLIDLVDPEAED